MPVEGLEPSIPCGNLFLRQTRIPFRHAGEERIIHAGSYHYLSRTVNPFRLLLFGA